MKYPTYKQPIQKINEDLYLIVAEYPIDRIKDSQEVKKWLECETVFKSNKTNTYLFCNKIQEAEIIE